MAYKEILRHIQEQEAANITPTTWVASGKRNLDKNGKPKEGSLHSLYDINNTLQKGSFSVVYPSQVYRAENGDIVKKTHKNFVTKVIDLTRVRSIADTINLEYELTRHAGQLGIKPPVIDKKNGKAFLTMTYIPGEDLVDLMQRLDTEPLNDLQLIDLTYALLLALKEQVIDKNIVHRDIKPDNIRIHMGAPIKVVLIDYGLAKWVNTDDCRYPGTPMWTAPEISNHKTHGSPADIFSLGRVIAYLWGQLEGYYGTLNEPIVPPFKIGINCRNAYFRLSLPEKNKWMEPFLKNMLHPKPESRKNIDELLKQFKELVHLHVLSYQFSDEKDKATPEILEEDVVARASL